MAVVVAPAVGPTLGGWITDNYSWHWIFFINLPVGLVSLALSYYVLVEPPAETEHRGKLLARGLRVDYIGFGLVALGLGTLQVVLDKGQRDDWFGSNFIVTLFGHLGRLADCAGDLGIDRATSRLSICRCWAIGASPLPAS